jgi:hypothetical protein
VLKLKRDPDIARPAPTTDLTFAFVQITFRKMIEQRVSTWEAVRGKRTRVPGTTMALGRGGMPHDLVQLVVEGALKIDRGFWGSIAGGATFRSTGRKRTRPGRAVISANRQHLVETEAVVAEHVARWRRGAPTPAARHLSEVETRWAELGEHEELVIEWPSLLVATSNEQRIADVR